MENEPNFDIFLRNFLKTAINSALKLVFTNVHNIGKKKAGPAEEGRQLMAKKVNSDFKSAVLLILREDFCALRNVFTNSGQSASKSASKNPAQKQRKNKKPPKSPKPEKIAKT